MSKRVEADRPFLTVDAVWNILKLSNCPCAMEFLSWTGAKNRTDAVDIYNQVSYHRAGFIYSCLRVLCFVQVLESRFQKRLLSLKRQAFVLPAQGAP